MKRVLAAVAVVGLVTLAWAVGPAAFIQGTEADFTSGTLDQTAVSSLGELTLGMDVQPLLQGGEDVGMVSAVAADGKGVVYFASAPQAALYRLDKDKPVKLAALPGVLVRAIIVEKDGLLAGLSGKSAGLYRVNAKGEVSPVWTDPQVTYVWAVVPVADGWYVATGPQGKIYQVSAEGKADVLYASTEQNILCLALGKTGKLYAGSAENGLVFEIDPAKKTGRVLYDAAEKEISSLVVGDDGVLYAATSDSTRAASSGDDGPRPRVTLPTTPTKPSPSSPTGATAAAAGDDPDGGLGGASPLPATGVATASAPRPTASVPASGPASRVAMQTPPRVPTTTPATGAPSGPVVPAGPSGLADAGTGNAVYRIDAEGFVRAIFRKPVSILAMALHNGQLVLATGHAGQIFTVSLTGDLSSTLVAKVDSKDLTALASDGQGKLIVGATDKAGLFALAKGYAAKGTFLSKVLDAGQIARWGTLTLRASVPAGCKATIATRSGNMAEVKDSTWSAWSDEVPVDKDFAAIASPAGRFVQYRLTLAGSAAATPVIEQVRMIYQVGNQAPSIKGVAVAPSARPQAVGGVPSAGKPAAGEDEQPMRYRVVQLSAADPNGDTLQYAVYARKLGSAKWIKLADKLTGDYGWDTLGTENGVYEIKVEVTDAASNSPETALTASRTVHPVVVDTVAPQIANLAVKVGAKGELTISGSASDISRIKSIAYSIDSNDEWVVVSPKDGMFDSNKKDFTATAKDVKDGTHRIAVRVLDEYNNAGYASAEVTVGR